VQKQTDIRIVRIQRRVPELFESLDALHRAFIQNSLVPSEQFMDSVSERLDDEAMLLILALAGDTAIGYGMAFDVADHPCMPEWRRSGYITQLYVVPERRRSGVGRMMADFVLQWLGERGVADVLLNVVPDNPVSNQFWQSQGFEPCRIRMKREVMPTPS
jgi:GNAT superfamily N-acetyltransferase